MKTAIFQIFIGQPHEGYKLCINSVKSYSQGKADYFISNKTRINGPSVYFEKLQCLDLLDHYDRVLLIDCDILVTPKAKISLKNTLKTFCLPLTKTLMMSGCSEKAG